ncbi:MAG TPA: type VI secretion system baseplate subunit TssK [Phnomibacter sp.]|nr:type VI secretion system baseplate subunit TssK [Phnomibacter sp.]
MRDRLKHYPVNWQDGMKINKQHFISQDEAWQAAVQDAAAHQLSAIQYGLLPLAAGEEDNFNVSISVDNQLTVRVTVMACQAVTAGGARISIPGLGQAMGQADAYPTISHTFEPGLTDTQWWVILLVHPLQRQPAGSPNLQEVPARLPFTQPSYQVVIANPADWKQYQMHPYAMPIGKLKTVGNSIVADEEYIPPACTISASPDLQNLLQEIDSFMGNLESRCSAIVQKIFKKSQPNDLSELVQFLCDRMMLHIGSSLTTMRWMMLHQSPAYLFAALAALARVMKNTIDLRIGSGKEEMMNYLCEWCELKQGELETMLISLAAMRYDHNDVNANIPRIVEFVRIIDRLFDTLSKLDYIGKRRDAGIFVKEEKPDLMEPPKAKRRFFG